MKVGFFDSDDDGVVDDPDLFDTVIGELTSPTFKYVFFQTVTRNGFEEQDPVLNSEFVVSRVEGDISDLSVYANGQKFYFYSTNTFKSYNSTSGLLVALTGYTSYIGRDSLYYRYNHGAPRSRRIDPAVSNMIDVYVMTKTYDQEFRTWLKKNQSTAKPVSPTIATLNETYGPSLNQLKSVSDEIIFNPGNYKLVFGPGAEPELQATFKIVKNPATNVSDNQLKSSVVESINTYFSLGLWDFGDTFYFSELAAFLHNSLTPDVLSVVIVPAQASSGFGSLFQINSSENEILISSATVDNVEMITSITAEKIKATGTVVVSSDTASTDNTATVTSTATSSNSSSSGGYY